MAIISNGTTIADAGSFSASLGSMVHIKTLTASSSSTLSFVHGSASVVLDSTYPIYLFKFINLHPGTNDVTLMNNFSVDSGSNYNVTKTTTAFYAEHYEDDSATTFTYYALVDLAQSANDHYLSGGVGAGNDDSFNGELFLFNPSSTTFVKHFSSESNQSYNNNNNEPRSINWRTAGYCNTTSAVNAVIFKFNSGNIDSGTIKLYGIKDS
tara:strand:- start:22 stop:651 length:630 start_codon:yes stop_codon:yes gene_type:complete